MRFDTDLPRNYEGRILNLPAFDSAGNLTERVSSSLENALYLYSHLGKLYAEKTDNNPSNLAIERISIVGSCARENRIHSDIDYLFICPGIDDQSGRDLKLMMSVVLFTDRDKREAVDVYIRNSDKYPQRKSIDITTSVKDMIDRYNSHLIE